jgi:hypothetical protein
MYVVKAWRRGLTRSMLRWTCPLFAAYKEGEKSYINDFDLKERIDRAYVFLTIFESYVEHNKIKLEQ